MNMNLSARARRKMVAALNRLDSQSGEIRNCFAARAHFRWSAEATAVVGVVGSIMIAAYLAGYFLAPGWLVIFGLMHVVKPPRLVAIADNGVVVASRSFVSGKPNAVVGRFDFDALDVVTQWSRTAKFGDDELTFGQKDHEKLVAILADARRQPV